MASTVRTWDICNGPGGLVPDTVVTVKGSFYFYAPNKGAPIFFTVAFTASGLYHAYQCMSVSYHDPRSNNTLTPAQTLQQLEDHRPLRLLLGPLRHGLHHP